MYLRNIMTFLRTPNLIANITIMKDMQSYLRFHFLYGAFESGLLNFLQTPATGDEINKSLNIKRTDLMEVLLDLGLSLKELKRKGNYYHLKGRRSKAIAEHEGDGLTAVVQSQVTYYNNIYRHFNERLHGAADGDYLETIGDIVARFANLLEPYLKNIIHDAVYKKGPISLLEVGCGHGLHLKTAVDINPEINAIGIDMDENVVNQAKSNLIEWQIQDKCSVILGDIRKPDTSFNKEYDMITLHNIIYYFPLNERKSLLKSLKNMLKDNGKIVITTTTKSNGRSYMAANLDTAARSIKGCYPVPEIEELMSQLKEAGFQNIKACRLLPGDTYYGFIACKK